MTFKLATKSRLWLKVLIGGLILWVACIAVLWSTNVTTLIPVVIFIGSFLSPIVFAVWVIEREDYSGVTPDGQPTALSIQLVVAAFVVGGLLGVILAALLESVILPRLPGLLWYPGVGVIEETIKFAIVWWLARSLTKYYIRDGMVLGACVGFGFAAFETSGYAFNALIAANDQQLLPVVETQLIRGLLTPVGHGLWTAILAGALFAAASKKNKLQLTWSVFGWWCVVVVLHAVWDASTGLAVIFTLLTTGDPATVNAFETGKISNPTATQTHLIAFYSWVLLTGCALIGIFLANRMWVRGRALTPGFPYGPGGEQVTDSESPTAPDSSEGQGPPGAQDVPAESRITILPRKSQDSNNSDS